jgi:hypothetical protein
MIFGVQNTMPMYHSDKTFKKYANFVKIELFPVPGCGSL